MLIIFILKKIILSSIPHKLDFVINKNKMPEPVLQEGKSHAGEWKVTSKKLQFVRGGCVGYRNDGGKGEMMQNFHSVHFCYMVLGKCKERSGFNLWSMGQM